MIPAAAADAIATAAARTRFDAAALARAARASGTIAIPFVEALTERVRAARCRRRARSCTGARPARTSSTRRWCCCLQRAARSSRRDHAARSRGAARARRTRTPTRVMLGRTLLQPATPITFGLKAAGWYAAVTPELAPRSAARFDEALVVQFGGASGTLAALGDQGPAVARALARELGLPIRPRRGTPSAIASPRSSRPAASTPARSARSRATSSLLMQDEVGEAPSRAGGGSSTMPHKRNPVGLRGGAGRRDAHARAGRGVSLPGMVQEHERGVGGWQAEWPTVAAVRADDRRRRWRRWPTCIERPDVDPRSDAREHRRHEAASCSPSAR